MSLRKKNILFLAHDALLYGPGRNLLTFIDELIQRGYNCYVILPSEGVLLDALKKRNIKFAIIKTHWWISGAIELKSLHDYFTYYLSKDFLRRVYYRFYKPYYNIFVALPKFRVYLKKWDIDVVINNSMVSPMGILLKLRYRIPVLLYVGESIHDIGNDMPYFIMKKLMKLVDGQIYVSHYIKKQYRGAYTRYVRVVYNCLERNQLNIPLVPRNEIRKFLMVGRISYKKGQMTAVRAIHLLRDVYPSISLTIVGTGDSSDIEKYVMENNLQNHVKLVGWTDHPVVYYRSCDCSIICSENEAFGKVIIESMAFGCPVIGRSVAAMPELIEDDKTGLLYYGDYIELAAKMKELIDDPLKANRIAVNAYEYVNKTFSIDNTVNQIEECINFCIKQVNN